MNPRAILSVYDKLGLHGLGRALTRLGWELVASGGTARELQAAGLVVREVAAVTGAPEMLGGRVKTLHPAVHGGILARSIEEDLADLAAYEIRPIDLVVCNLYPFEETIARPGVTLAEAVEQIDIGGVALLRAAAKNFDRVTVLCDPNDYGVVIKELSDQGAVTPATRRRLALKAFEMTRDYDTAIAAYLAGGEGDDEPLPRALDLRLTRSEMLRYGENPHQPAALYAAGPGYRPLGGTLLQGKALSYNNLLDADAAWRAAEGYDEPVVVIVKHLSPCGIATAESPAAAFPAALASDPVSAFGSVIAVNRPVDEAFTAALREAGLFVEAVVAPDFSTEAAAYFAAKKKNCRLVKIDSDRPSEHEKPIELRSIRGGVLVQGRDQGDPETAEWRVVTRRRPTVEEAVSLRTAWQAVQHVKSNAIVIARGQATVGIGGGMTSRVDAAEVAAKKAGERARGAALGSDAFFPFPDGVEAAAAAGVTAIVQPGGSIRDEEVIAAADQLGLAMVFTGARHFRH